MTQNYTKEQMLSMSDEELMNLNDAPPLVEGEVSNHQEETPDDDKPEVDGGNPPVEEDTTDTDAEDKQDPPEEDTPPSDDNSGSDKPNEDGKGKKEPEPENKEEQKPAEEKQEPEPINYEDAYKKLMAPVKANGRMVQFNSPEELIAAAQKGIDYTKKMQALKPNLKLMKMLQNNNLLDEDKLNFVIDLVDRKNPAAIAKFLKDTEVDPLDLDLDKGKDYKAGDHSVSDAKMAFDSVFEDLMSTQTGKETIQIIDKEWDKDSHQRLYAEPDLMKLIDSHRQAGIYEQITAEMERLKLVGTIPDNVVFLDAYKSVGDALHAAGKLIVNGVPTNHVQPKQQPSRQVVDTKPVTAKPKVNNNPAVSTAAPTRTNPSKPAASDFNPLSMSDEEFEKQSAGSFRI